MARCFLALRLPAATRQALEPVREELASLPRDAARKIKPVAPHNLHVTVKFLGNMTPQQQTTVIAALETRRPELAAADAQLAGIDAFPSVSRPRVVVAPARDAEQVVALLQTVDAICSELGFEPERRPPRPHVTVARVASPKPNGPLQAWLRQRKSAAPQVYGPIDGRRLVLYESHLTAAGASYAVVWEGTLGTQ